MTTFELLTRLEAIEKVFADSGEVDKWIEDLPKSFSLSQALNFLISSESTEDAWKKLTSVNNSLTRIVGNVREMRAGKVFVTLGRWMNELDQIGLGFDPELRGIVEELSADVRSLYDSYDSFVSAHGLQEAVELIESAKRLIKTKRVAVGLIVLTRSSLLPKPKIEEGNAAISLFLSAEATYESTLSKLSALYGMYSELCRLMDVSTSERPLHIVRIEAGSLWALLMGESRVVQLMTSLIESGVAYMHRNFTREGKVQVIPRNAEVINSLLSLSEKLEASGIDNTVLKENIQQSAVVLGKELNKLLLGEPVVKVDGRTHSIGDEWEKGFLLGSKTLFLESGSEIDEDSVGGDVPER